MLKIFCIYCHRKYYPKYNFYATKSISISVYKFDKIIHILVNYLRFLYGLLFLKNQVKMDQKSLSKTIKSYKEPWGKVS